MKTTKMTKMIAALTARFGMATLVAAAISAAIMPMAAFAEAVTADDVTAVVAGWKNAREALGEQLTAAPASVREYSGLGGTGTYYVVSLEGGGYVVTSGDTSLEPVLAYSKTGTWVDDVKRNPLMAMVEIDIAAATVGRGVLDAPNGGGLRLAAGGATASVQQQEGVAGSGSTGLDVMAELSSANQAKWARYKAGASQKGGVRLRATAPNSDLRVSPLIKSAWSQSGNGENYYTPGGSTAGNPGFVCGCVATMCAQMMKYWEWPKGTNITAIANYTGSVTYGEGDSAVSTQWDLEGGYYRTGTATTKTSWTAYSWPAFGGTYDWDNMPLTFSRTTTIQKQAVGHLTRDCGIACGMGYANGGSGASGSIFAHRAADQFAYTSGQDVGGWNDANRDALLACLDAGIPCGIAVSHSSSGHAIIADGYGYTSGTLYIHFNYGWGSTGPNDWYTPPNVGTYTSVNDIIVNVYPPYKNKYDRTIVSGRVLSGTTVQKSVTVTATNRETGFSTNVTSNTKGIYSFMLPRGYYTFTATKNGSSAKVEADVKPGIAGTGSNAKSGNIHGLDLKLGTAVTAPSVSLTHRWSFTGNLNDTVGSSTATTIGSNVAIEDGKAVCAGSGAGQGSLNLGSNLLNTDGATIEIWAANDAIVSGSRIFEYGVDSSHYFMMAWTKDTDFYTDCVEAFSTANNTYDNSLAPYTLGRHYHIAVTFERQGDGTTKVRATRRDAASGAIQRAAVYTVTNGIHTFSSPILRLGRSFQGNGDAKATYDEVRVWQGVLSDAQLNASALAGPDANLSTLPWNASAVRYVAKATWTGGTPSSSADLENSANWSCADQNGDAITGVPEARSLVIIPNGSTGFTIPSGYTPAWRKVRLGSEGKATAQWASKVYTQTSLSDQLDPAASAYTLQGDADVDVLARSVAPSVQDAPAGLGGKQFRYDGWVNVTAAQAGRWAITAYADDYAAFRLDDEWTAFTRVMGDGMRTAVVDVPKGWHRFTIIIGDYYGGYGGCAVPTDHSCAVPVVISIDGGNSIAFTSSNFTFGAPDGAASTVTLSGDCNLTAVDEVVLDSGATLDLNGHTLKVNAISSSYLGTTITNTSATEATLGYVVPLAESGALGNIAIAPDITIKRAINNTYTWVGGASGNISVASNWSPTPTGAFTCLDELMVDSPACITVDAATTVGIIRFNTAGATRFAASGANVLTVTQITNEGTATFDCPVQFSDTYYVEQTGAVKFPGGATATYPDPALRTASSSDLARTLDGVFTFTADWNVPNLGDGNHPWIIPEGAEVYGQVFTGSESGNNRILYIADGGYARFTTVAIGNNCGDLGIDGFLEATTEVTVGSKGGSNNLGSGGTTGTIKAPCIRKVGGYYVYVKIPNMIVGVGGFGAGAKDYDLRFHNDVNITASTNFEFIGTYSTSNPKDWNLNLNGKTLTINVPEGLTVTFGVTATASGVVRKKGTGTLIMTDTDKKGVSGYVKDYTGGTFIEEGTVRVAASNQIGTGDVTIYPGARLELAAGVTLDNVVKTSAPGVGSLYMENGSSVALSATTPCSLASFELASGARATITTSSSADAGAVLLSGAAGDYASRLTVPSGFTFAGGCVLVPAAAAAATDYVWVGASGGSWSAASNWRVNGATPAAAPGSGDTIRFDNGSAMNVGGSGTLTVTKIVTTTGAPVTFNVPVAFAGTYLVENAVVPPVFAAGATATYPDASLTSMNAVCHILPDGLTLTQDWTIPLQPANNPFVVPAGAHVTGKVLSAETYNASQPDLRIDDGAVATFDSVSVNRRFVVWLNGGRLVATGDVLFNGTGGGGDFGYYAQPNVGAVEAHGVYKSASGGGSITCYVTNFVVGAGGFGMFRRDYMWGFQRDTRLTATDNLTIHEPHTDGGALDSQKDDDWGFNFNGHTFTVDTAGHTVTFDSYVRESASQIVKEGAGEMIMRSRQKKHAGGMDVKAGKVTMAMANGAGYGTATVRSGATLAFTSAATSQAYPIIVKSGATLEWAAAVNDTSTLTLEGGAILKPAPNGAFTVGTLALAGGSGPVLIDMTGLNIGPGMSIPILGGVASGEEALFKAIVPSGLEGELLVNASGVLRFATRDAMLTHRWSFNDNYNDPIGSANATIGGNGGVSLSGGKAILAGGAGAGYLNLGAGVLGTGYAATLELWATNITEASNWAYLLTYGIHDNATKNLITLCNRSNDGLSYGRTTRNGMLEGDVNGSQFIRDNQTLIGMPESMAYHYSVTFRVNGANTDTRWMVRNAATGFLLAERSVTIPNLTLAGASAAGWMLTLGHNPFTNSNLDLNCGFDEVRVWDGILTDEQLMAHAITGPDAPLGSNPDCVVVNPGETFTVGTVGGYGYKTDLPVVLGTGAKIRFDTTGYFGKGLRFKTGGITVPSGNVLDYVELSDTANYAATMEDANTILVQLKSTIPYESTWSGAAPSVAADLANAANWTSVNAQGATISAAPTAKTTVVLPASVLATFSVPEGATANWGRVLLGGRTVTQAGRIAGTPNMNKLAYLYRDVSDYTSLGAAEVSSINGNGSGVAFLKNYLVQSQVRFDGWVNVPADKAGRWFINCQFDDAVTLFIDGERVFHDPCWTPAVVGGCFVSEGWHRFTLIAADGGGGYGCHANDTVNGTKVPFRITVNGSLTAFHAFTFGSDSSTVTLSQDCDWRALGALEVMDGLTIDLNGHALAVADITRSSLGASITNSSASTSSLYVAADPSSSAAQTSGMVDSSISILQTGSRSAFWTGGANNGGNALTPGNWTVRNGAGMIVSGGLPDSETVVVVSGDNVNLQIPSSSTFQCASLTIQDCTLTADCDWRGLAVTPTITGTADLNGYDLRLNHLAANADSALANSGEGVSGVVFDATAGGYNESSYVDGLANLGTSENAHIVILRNDDDSLSSLAVGNTANVWTEVRLTAGTISGSGTAQLFNTANAHGILTVDGADVTVNALNVPNGDIAGTATLNVHSGSFTVTTWTDFGNSASAVATFNQTGGTVDVGTVRKGNTGNGNFWFGRSNSGTATYNLANGTFSAWGSFRIGSAGSSKGIFNQSGGIVNVMSPSYDFSFGYDGGTSGKYYQTGGTLNTERNIDLRRSGSLLDIGGAVTMTVDGKGVNIATVSGESGEVILREGGVLTTSFLKKGSGTAHATFAGGKIVAKDANNASTFISGIGDVTYAAGGLTVDTAGYNVNMVNNVVSNALPGSALVKQGTGTLTVDALPPVDRVKVEGGTLALSADVDNSAPAHRWSFTDGSLADSAGNSTAVQVGSASFADNAVTFPGGGNGSCYLNLGNDVIPSTGDVTIELWGRRNEATHQWASMFSIGVNANNNNSLRMAWSNHIAGDGSTDMVYLKKNGSNIFFESNTMTPYTVGTMYHISMRFVYNADGSTTITWDKRNASTGAIEKTCTRTVSSDKGWSLADYAGNPFVLNHGYDNDDEAATYDEVRIWNGALDDEALTLSAQKGPDATASDLVAVAVGRVLELAGGTLDLGGHALTQPRITGIGTVTNGTLNVGTLTPGGDGTTGTVALNVASVSGVIRIDSGDTFTTTTAGINLSGATIDLAFTPTASYTVATASGSGSFNSEPALTVNGAPLNGWKVRRSADGKALRIKRIRGMSATIR